jgi:hypothetical protein
MVMGLFSVSAVIIFLRPDWSSRQIVPRETPIFFPACSWSSSSLSTNRIASNSEAKSRIWMEFFIILGVKVVGVGTLPRLIGFGGRPLPRHPRRYRIVFQLGIACSVDLYISVH